MNPELLSANVSLALIGVAGFALLAHATQLAGPQRLLHGTLAATAAGLVYLFAERALGWRFAPSGALSALYALLFIGVAFARYRRDEEQEDGFPWTAILVQPAALAFVFAPAAIWRPAISAALAVYFLFEFFGWLKGREAIPESSGTKDHRPPLFPPKRIRGLREFAGAAAAAALLYVFAMGTGRAPVAPEPDAQASAGQTQAAAPESQSAEAPASPEEGSPAQPPVPAPEAAAPAGTYAAKSGETPKSIARKLYGKAAMLPALLAANPGLRPGTKLKAGQTIKLPQKP